MREPSLQAVFVVGRWRGLVGLRLAASWPTISSALGPPKPNARFHLASAGIGLGTSCHRLSARNRTYLLLIS